MSALSEKASVWLEEQYQATIRDRCLKNEVLQKITEITHIIEDYAEVKESESNDKEISNNRLDWDAFYEISSSIMDQYTHDIDGLLNDLDKLCRVCIVQLVSFFFFFLSFFCSITNPSNYRSNICGKTQLS